MMNETVNCHSYFDTTFSGFPFKNAFIFSVVIFIMRFRASLLIHAIWGVIMQFFAFNNGLVSPGGSVETTSSAAPAIVPLFNASAKSFSFTNWPLAVLMIKAVGFI